jgi:hypothetical protein
MEAIDNLSFEFEVLRATPDQIVDGPARPELLFLVCFWTRGC